jgi:hypothetical protein
MDNNDLVKEYGHLKAGQKYTIVKTFRDYNNYPYEKSKIIEFIGSNFVPYEDGLSLFCIYNGSEHQIRLQLRPESQEEIVNNLEQYMVLVSE